MAKQTRVKPKVNAKAKPKATPKATPKAKARAKAKPQAKARAKPKVTAKAAPAIRLGDFAVTLADIQAAAKVLRRFPHVQQTPLLTCRTLSAELSARVGRPVELHFKCEHLQSTGSFKIRGATFACSKLQGKGVITHSSGNHGAALAFAAQQTGKVATVVVPTNAPASKLAAIARYGARIVPCEPTLQSREGTAAAEQAKTGASMVPPFNSPLTMAGQGTLGLEWYNQARGLGGADALVIPVSGGGLISGCTVAAKSLDSRLRIFGVEPAAGCRAQQSRAAGSRVLLPEMPDTMCDALRIMQLGELTWPVIRDLVDDCFTVSDEEVSASMLHVFERLKQVVEPAGAVATAGVFSPDFVAMLKRETCIRRIGVLLCGGNLDLKKALPFMA